jgi:hypothetical protein
MNTFKCGNTTRLADAYIQKLFQDKSIIVIEHKQDNLDIPLASTLLYNIIVNRLKLEHPNIKFDTSWEDFKILII